MHSLLLAALGLLHALLLGALVGARPRPVILLGLGLPLLGLVYDNAVLALGARLGVGPLLHGLSVPRFVLHALGTPLWALAGGELARDAGPGRARAAWFRPALVAAVLGLILAEVAHLPALELAPVAFADTLRYTHARPSGPPVGAIGTLVILLAVGGAVSRWVVLASLALFVLAALPLGRVGPVPGNAGEALLGLALVVAARRTTPGADRDPATPGPGRAA